ncbi:MAG: hypothetical protein ACKN9T_13910 [Candidatus Methylumidiphilus sp.]
MRPPTPDNPSLLALALAFALTALPTFAIDWSFKAFGTLGAIGTDTDRISFVRDQSQTQGAGSDWGLSVDSRLGLQLDADFNNEFHAMVQWVARDHAGDYFEQNLDWAFLRWRPRDDLTLRLGRMAIDAFLISDYRNIGYAYPWMRPPAEFYGLFGIYHFDGADIAKRFNIGDGRLTVKGYAGHSNESAAYGVEYETLIFGGNLVYEIGDWRARVGYFQSQELINPLRQADINMLDDLAKRQIWPEIQSTVNYLRAPNKRTHFSSIGLAYDDGVWPVQAEAGYLDSEWPGFANRVNGYLSVGRRFGKLTTYSLYGFEQSLTRRLEIPQAPAQYPELIGLRNDINQGLNRSVDQMSISLGVRWDVYHNIDLKAQWLVD